MSIRNANNENLEELYTEHMERDFPATERPSFVHFKKTITDGIQDVLIYSEEGEDKAYCVVATVSEYLLISFLAVYEEHRGSGVGSQMLAEVKAYYKDKTGLIVEVEKPEDTKDEKERVLRERRIAFYARAGYVLFREIDYIIWDVPFFLMASDKETTAEEVIVQIKKIYGKLLRPQFQDKLKIRLLNS